jgi:hypothetical protein
MLTRRSIELLLDLVENKLDLLEVVDREDREVARELEKCRRGLAAAIGKSEETEAMPEDLRPAAPMLRRAA